MELITFGNYCLQNDRFTFSQTSNRSLNPVDIQKVPITRANGSAVVNTRLSEREIELSGTIKADSNTEYLDNRLAFEKAMEQGERKLRFLPEYTQVVKPTSSSSWVAQYDATNITYITNDYQTSSGAIQFDIDVSLDATHRAGIRKSFSAVDLSIENGTIEWFFYVPDAQYIQSCEIILDNAANTNMYYRVYSNNDGNGFVNGWNLCVADINKPFLVSGGAGIFDLTTVDNMYFRIWYSASQPDMSGVIFDGFYTANDDYTRNYAAYYKAVDIDGNHYNNQFSNINIKFDAPEGFSTSSNTTDSFTSSAITTATDSEVIDLEGSYPADPNISITYTTITGVSTTTITNTTTGDAIVFDTTGVTAGSVLSYDGESKSVTLNGNNISYSGTRPNFKLGKNNLVLSIQSTSATTVPSSAITNTGETYINSSSMTDPSSWGTYRIAQTFSATATGNITQFKILARHQSMRVPSTAFGLYWMITSTSAGVPSTTVLATGYTSFTSTSMKEYTISGISVPVTSGTTYAIVFDAGYRQEVDMGVLEQNIFGSNSANPYASGSAYQSVNSPVDWSTNTGTYTILTNVDLDFSLTITPSPAWNISWAGSYKRKYNA